MCSSVRGPATVPSLVTWPMMQTDICVRLAICISRSVHSRTWLMLPGADGNCADATVWIESTTISDGMHLLRRLGDGVDIRLRQQQQARRRDAQPIGAQPNLLVRLLGGDVEHRAFVQRQVASGLGMSSVDLPMPGSPPTSISVPGTMPPPSTRSNSGEPVLIRRASTASTSVNGTGCATVARNPPPRTARAAQCGRDRLDERVPLAAIRAAPHPLDALVATLLADKFRCRFWHDIFTL